jgi:pimeloyl-ACP methyl ester carboxylesterase
MLQATAEGLADQLGALASRPPRYIPVVGDPGTFAVMSTPDAKQGFEALVPQSTRWENRVAARIALRIGAYSPGRSAAKLACPALFCVCDQDSVAPAQKTIKLVSQAPHGEVKRYPIGHFDIYVGEWFERAVADQTEFLVRVLR